LIANLRMERVTKSSLRVGHSSSLCRKRASVRESQFHSRQARARSSVRKIARDAGYNHLRGRLSDAAMTGDSRNTFNGWKITKREGKWIDDVLTSRSVRPYSGVVELTDTTAYPIFVTDHNGVFARVEFGVPGV
jgi:hypothetical protein